MRRMLTLTTLLVAAGAIALDARQGAAPPAQPQTHDHAAMNARGARVMGFDQAKTTHHFYLYEDGGAIDITVKDASDAANLAAIRAHLAAVARAFGSGDYPMPEQIHHPEPAVQPATGVHGSQTATPVPGTAELARLKDRVKYHYSQTPKGGRVDITTKDAAALKALHEFLRFQITGHTTGDSLDPKKRG